MAYSGQWKRFTQKAQVKRQMDVNKEDKKPKKKKKKKKKDLIKTNKP